MTTFGVEIVWINLRMRNYHQIVWIMHRAVSIDFHEINKLKVVLLLLLWFVIVLFSLCFVEGTLSIAIVVV